MSSALIPSAFSTQLTLPANTDLSVEIDHCIRTTHPDGTISETIYTNPEKVTCPTCDKPFRNQAKLDAHRRDFYWPCKVCDRHLNWCRVGAKGYAQVPYCRYTCVEHGECFETGEEAQDHGLRVGHTRCFYPRCTSGLAKGRVHEWYGKSVPSYEVYVDKKTDVVILLLQCIIISRTIIVRGSEV
jgi:hypothetical protein